MRKFILLSLILLLDYTPMSIAAAGGGEEFDARAEDVKIIKALGSGQYVLEEIKAKKVAKKLRERGGSEPGWQREESCRAADRLTSEKATLIRINNELMRHLTQDKRKRKVLREGLSALDPDYRAHHLAAIILGHTSDRGRAYNRRGSCALEYFSDSYIRRINRQLFEDYTQQKEEIKNLRRIIKKKLRLWGYGFTHMDTLSEAEEAGPFAETVKEDPRLSSGESGRRDLSTSPIPEEEETKDE